MATLKAELARLADRVDGLESIREQVEMIADQMLAEAEKTQAAQGHNDDVTPVAWIDLDADQALSVFRDLMQWMDVVLVHHTPVTETLRPCWFRHPAVVQVLLDVRAGWLRAYRSPGRSDAVLWALEWSGRHLPHLEQFLARELGRCTTARHDPDRVPMPRVDECDVRAYLQGRSGDGNAVGRPTTTDAPGEGSP
ncbi:DUF4913 domain-containing protein [Nocardiopsis rhodophaea]|uniref:DUF4913 domain-containing protein n=1 Tax=Nocardiopsis rhodophaea TaxID=280238 RepID=UPI0031CE63B8